MTTKPSVPSRFRPVHYIILIVFFALVAGVLGFFAGQTSEPVIPGSQDLISEGDPVTGVYPRYADTGLVEWNQVKQGNYPQVKAYDKAFRDNFPQLVEGAESTGEGYGIKDPADTGILVCSSLGDMPSGEEAVDHVYVEMETEDIEVKKQVANLAIEILCPEFLADSYTVTTP